MLLSLKRFWRLDGVLLFAFFILVLIGLLAIYGIGLSSERPDLFLFYKQTIGALIGMTLLIGISFVDYRALRSYAIVAYVVGFVVLAGVLLFGTSIHATRGWFVFGRLSFQPVEIAKVTLAIFLAAYFAKHSHRRMGWIPLLGSGIATLGYVGLVMLQPDFGSAVVMIVLWGACALFVGLPRRAWIILGTGALIAAMALWAVGLKPYQRARLSSFLDPSRDPRGAGYNVTQARIAIGSGGIFGKGIGEGSQARLRFLPEASTDFIFSVIGEELGFIGVSTVLGLYALLFFRLWWIARGTADPFAQTLLISFVSILAFHVFVNVGMNLGVMPVTGIPLPFISAAVSSLVAGCLMIGIAQSVMMHRA